MSQDMELFPKHRVAGVFRGFTEGGLEFHADLILPYQISFQDIPMHGQFLLIQLATPDEAVLGRITSMSAEGRLSSGQGDEFAIRAMQEARPIPEDLREQYVRYRVNIRVLGAVRKLQGAVHFVPSQRRLPHVGSLVAFPSDDVLQELAGHNDPGVALGFYALGEFVWGGQNRAFRPRDWTRPMHPGIMVNFDLNQLISRRTFIFARAGFGKSNVNKLLFSQLYRTTPMKDCKRRKQVPVGTVLFDPEGEYFWSDVTGRPGLCDVPHLRDKLVVFTSRMAPSDFYGSFVAGETKLDLRRFRAADVISIALSPDRQEQQNVRKLRGLNPEKWGRLVELIDRYGNDADLAEIGSILSLEKSQEVEALAARGNMTAIVRMFHSRTSQFMDLLMAALSEGIPTEILSQGDNWFVFHLLSAADLTSLKRANAHFSDDILSSLLNEPIAGQGVFWSSAGKRAYPIPLSTLSFESLYQVDELIASGPAVETYASRLKDRFAQALKDAQSDLEGSRYPEGIPGASKARDVPGPEVSTVAGEEETREDPRDEEEVDALRLYKTRAVQKVRQRRDQMARLRGEPGLAWGYLMGLLRDQLPETLEDRGDVAYYLVREVLDEELGPGSWESHWVQRPDRRINYVRALPQKE